MRGRGVQPRRGVVRVGRMLPVEGDEHVLRDVFGLIGIRHDTVGDRYHADVLLSEQRFEGRRYAWPLPRRKAQTLRHFHLFLQSTAEPRIVTSASSSAL